MRRPPVPRLVIALVLGALVPLASACGTVAPSLDVTTAAPPTAPATADAREDRGPATALAPAPRAEDAPATFGEALPPAAAPWMQQPFAERLPGAPPEPAELRAAQTPTYAPESAEPPRALAADSPGTAEVREPAIDADPVGMAQARESVIDADPEDYDPWEWYNERMFAFNYNVDRYVLKPAANVYRHIVPEPFQLMISNGFDNIRYPARLVNHVLQGRFWGAFIETSRFVINSTLGVGGLFNPASEYFGIEKSRADFGQTLYRWGVGSGPYFVPPLLPPATVRDFFGRLADSALNPIAWFLIDFWPEGFAIGAGEMLNERAVNYEVFQGVEETTLDLYTAVRDGYLRRRERQLRLESE